MEGRKDKKCSEGREYIKKKKKIRDGKDYNVERKKIETGYEVIDRVNNIHV